MIRTPHYRGGPEPPAVAVALPVAMRRKSPTCSIAVAAEAADPGDRAFSRWLNAVEKVVISTTVPEEPWHNTRMTADGPATVVKQLRERGGGDIVVLGSATIIRALLAEGELDRLSITLCPELVGGGAQLFEDTPAGSSWSLTEATPTPTGALCLLYDRRVPGPDVKNQRSAPTDGREPEDLTSRTGSTR
jgi:dihydrofolate reductase